MQVMIMPSANTFVKSSFTWHMEEPNAPGKLPIATEATAVGALVDGSMRRSGRGHAYLLAGEEVGNALSDLQYCQLHCQNPQLSYLGAGEE